MSARLFHLTIKEVMDEFTFQHVQSAPTDGKFVMEPPVTGLWYRIQQSTELVSRISLTINLVSVYLTYVAGSADNRS